MLEFGVRFQVPLIAKLEPLVRLPVSVPSALKFNTNGRSLRVSPGTLASPFQVVPLKSTGAVVSVFVQEVMMSAIEIANINSLFIFLVLYVKLLILNHKCNSFEANFLLVTIFCKLKNSFSRRSFCILFKANYYLAGCVGFCGACAGGVGAVGKEGTVDFAAPSVNVFTCSLEPTFGTTKAVITHKANKAIALPQVVFSITSPALCTPITLEAALPMPPLKPPPLGF